MSYRLVLLAATLLCSSAYAVDRDARLVWADQLSMGPMVSGVVSEIMVRAGEVVSKDQVLLLLDDREFKARLMANQADVNAQKANYEESKRHSERGDELYERGALSGLATDQRRLEQENVRAAFHKAIAQRDLAKLDLERSVLRAPFTAKVMSVDVSPGQVVITRFQSQSLLTLVAHGRMRARTLIDVDQLSRLEPGMSVTVKTAGKEYQGKVVVLGVVPEGSSNYRLEVEFDHDAQAGLKAGQTATLALP